MIHPAYNRSEIARRYFEEKGETLSKDDAYNRFRMIRLFDKKILKKIFSDIQKEQKDILLE
jgi:hypothetical protein